MQVIILFSGSSSLQDLLRRRPAQSVSSRYSDGTILRVRISRKGEKTFEHLLKKRLKRMIFQNGPAFSYFNCRKNATLSQFIKFKTFQLKIKIIFLNFFKNSFFRFGLPRSAIHSATLTDR
jgi:hypothetical protein